MNSYEHTFITKQDLSESQNKKIIEKYEDIINKKNQPSVFHITIVIICSNIGSFIFWNTVWGSAWGAVMGVSYHLLSGMKFRETVITATTIGGGMGYRMPTIFNEESEPYGYKNLEAIDFTNLLAAQQQRVISCYIYMGVV